MDQAAIFDLDDIVAHPHRYGFFTFRPGVKKRVLLGTADAQHISILWYEQAGGKVGLHYHRMAEAVYVLEGTQRDAKGHYGRGALYFNPPGSGHEITESQGFFLLAYGAPPEFDDLSRITAYAPICVDTTAADLVSRHPFEPGGADVLRYPLLLSSEGGLGCELIQSSSAEAYEYTGNCLLMIAGRGHINGQQVNRNQMVVATTLQKQPYHLSTCNGDTCLALGFSF